MNEEQRRSMIDALEKSFAEIGVDVYAGSPRLLRLLDTVRPHVEASSSRDALDAYFAGANETEDAWIAVYMAFFTAVPSLLQQFATDCVVKTAESIPAQGGPPRKLTPEIEREIVKRVAALYTGDGVRIGVAQARVAQRLKLSKRTIQAVWSKRKQLAAQPFQSMQDVWDFFERTSSPRE